MDSTVLVAPILFLGGWLAISGAFWIADRIGQRAENLIRGQTRGETNGR